MNSKENNKCNKNYHFYYFVIILSEYQSNPRLQNYTAIFTTIFLRIFCSIKRLIEQILLIRQNSIDSAEKMHFFATYMRV